jgi:hypothetical protein
LKSAADAGSFGTAIVTATRAIISLQPTLIIHSPQRHAPLFNVNSYFE